MRTLPLVREAMGASEGGSAVSTAERWDAADKWTELGHLLYDRAKEGKAAA
jgi:hypothetical protein